MCTRAPAPWARIRRTAQLCRCSFGTRHGNGRSLCWQHLLDTPGARTLRRNSFGRFDYHQASDELLDAMDIEIDGGAVGVRLGDDPAPVQKMLDVLACRESLHKSLLFRMRSKSLALRTSRGWGIIESGAASL